MRLRAFAASSVCVSLAGFIAPAAAHAAGSETLYVAHSSACSDSGPGTLNVPYCTIQAAADATVPGDTVLIGGGAWTGDVNITKSGTTTQPIIFAGTLSAIGLRQTAVGSGSIHAFTVTASNVEIETLAATGTNSDAIVIDGASQVLLDRIGVSRAGGTTVTAAAGVHITGASSSVTLQRSSLGQATGPALELDGPVTGTVVSTNNLNSTGSPALVVSGATNTAITSNTAEQFCGAGFEVTGGASGTRIENNVLNDSGWIGTTVPCAGAGAGDEVSVDATGTSSTEVDYNDVCWAHTGATPYLWGATTYQTSAAFDSATGQGAHDSNAPNCGSTGEGSPRIDSADSGAVGELPVDFNGAARVDDPLDANTGAGAATYYDRGSIEVQDPVTVRNSPIKLSATMAPAGGTITATASTTDTWGDPLAYAFSFGDNTGTTSPSPTGVATHSYASAGQYQIFVYAVFNGVSQQFGATSVNIVAPAPLVPQLTILERGALTATADADGTTDAWNITGYTFDFGDGTPPVTTPNAAADHVYAEPGTYTVTEKITDAGGTTATKTATVTTTGSDYTPYGPTRILDTRNGTGAAKAKLAGGGVLKLKVAGNGSIPASGVTAVALNVTVTNPTGGGYVTVYPDGISRPATSNLDFSAGQTDPASVVTQLGADGYVDLYYGSSASASTDLIADVNGYYTQTAASGYQSLNPARLLDTRNGTGTGGSKAKLPGGQALTLTIAGADAGKLPASGITAVALNVTVTSPTGGGYLTVYPDGQSRPIASNLDFNAGQTVANTVMVPVGADGKIDLYYGAAASASVALIADVAGYFSTSASGAYVPLAPDRVFDTRTSSALGPVPPGGFVLCNPLVDPAVPANASAYTFNLTVTGTTASGYLTGFPYISDLPKVSNLDFGPGQTVANLALIQAGDIGDVEFYNGSGGTIQIIADLFGYYANS